jgi:hypothetical protein
VTETWDADLCIIGRMKISADFQELMKVASKG